MFTYKIFNNIAEDGLNILDGNDFHIDEIDPDSLIIRSQNLSNNDFNKSLKCIGRAGAGTNNIPVKDATDKGIVVFNTPGANANAVKELVVCGMLLSSRGIIQGNIYSKTLSGQNSVELNKSMESQKKNFKGNELKGKTLGIIGAGSIGTETIKLAKPFFKNILAYDPFLSEQQIHEKGAIKSDLNQLSSKCDFIVILCNLDQSTKGMINETFLSNMKQSAYIFNLSRGPVINEGHLEKALENKVISGAGLDVTNTEPISLDSKLLSFNNVVITPHALCWTDECFNDIAEEAIKSILNFIDKKPILNQVNL